MAVYQSELAFPLISRGKVRDIYETPDGVLLVATDRLSAFDVVFPDPIPCKGQVLNQLSAYWFGETGHIVRNHLISDEPSFLEDPALADMRGRCTLCIEAQPLPVECVVRGYLEGSAWNDYQQTGAVSGVKLPPGLQRREKLAHPIFTPSTKATSGHDEPISFEQVVDLIGLESAEFVRLKSVELYQFAHERLAKKNITLSDTKFEFGRLGDGELILIDEALTPDSSRFWESESYTLTGVPRSMDKQYVRDYVESIGWDKKPPAPKLPPEVIENMTRRYTEIYERITDRMLRRTES